MNVIAIMNHMGVYFKEEPIRELHRALERLDFRIVYPNDRDDLLKLIENNSRLCGVIFDWAVSMSTGSGRKSASVRMPCAPAGCGISASFC